MPSRSWKWMLTPAAYGFGLALVTVAAITVARFLPGRAQASDFSQVYLAAHARVRGLDPYTLDLTRYTRAQGLEFTELLPQASNPPLLVWFSQPLGRLPAAAAFRAMVAVEIGSLLVIFAASIALLRRQLSLAGWGLAAGLFCCSMPVFMHFWFTQVQLPLLALALAGAVAVRRGWPWLACVLLTLAAVLKLYPVPLVLLPALGARGRERWQLLAVTALCALGWAALPGLSAWISFCRHGLTWLGQFAGGAHYNFTFASFAAGVFGPDWPARCVGGGVSLGLIGWTWWQCGRQPAGSDVTLCLLLVVTVMCSMVAWVHYLVWLMYPMCVLAARRNWILFGVTLVCVNVAGSNPFDLTSPVLKLLNANLPLFVMAWCYVHFSRAEIVEV